MKALISRVPDRGSVIPSPLGERCSDRGVRYSAGGGVEEIVVEGASEWFYEVGDHRRMLNLINQTLSTPEEYAAFSDYGKQDVSLRFSQRRYHHDVIKSIDKLLI